MELCTDIIRIIASYTPTSFLSVNKSLSNHAKHHLLYEISFQDIVNTDNTELIIYAIEYYIKHRYNPSMFAPDKYGWRRTYSIPVSSQYLRIASSSISNMENSLVPIYLHNEYICSYHIEESTSTGAIMIEFNHHDVFIMEVFNRILLDRADLVPQVINASNIEYVANYLDFGFDDDCRNILEYCLQNIPEIYNCNIFFSTIDIFDLLESYDYDFSLCNSKHYVCDSEIDSPVFESNPELLIRFLKWERNGKRWYPNPEHMPSNIVIYVMNSVRPEITKEYFSN